MYLGIDLGTSSMKCLVIGEEQEIIHSVSSEDIPSSNPQSGWSEQDPSSWIVALDQCMLRLKSKININKINSVSFFDLFIFSLLIAKNVAVLISFSIQDKKTSYTFEEPCSWPNCRLFPCLSAHLPLPSIIKAICLTARLRLFLQFFLLLSVQMN